MDVKKEFGKKLKEIRTAKGMSQERLSELADVNQQQISKIERGQSFVTPDTLEKIAQALEVKIKFLFDFDSGSDKVKSEIEQQLNQMSTFKLKQIRDIAAVLNRR